jgi:hypothetical protein
VTFKAENNQLGSNYIKTQLKRLIGIDTSINIELSSMYSNKNDFHQKHLQKIEVIFKTF